MELWARCLICKARVFDKDTRSLANYYPFGMMEPGRQWAVDSSLFGYQGQLKDDEIAGRGNTLTAEFWEYDTRLGRRWNLDPKPVEGISSYVAFLDNPLTNVDINGDTSAAFKPSGEFWKIEDDGKPEWSIQYYTQSREVTRSYDGCKYNEIEFSRPIKFQFADPKNDPEDIKNGIINKLVFVDLNQVEQMLGEAGAFNTVNRLKAPSYMWNESKGGKKLDFSYSQIPFKFPESSSDPLLVPSSLLFIPKGDIYAHNHMNFGNFLWAAAGNSLGFSLPELKIAAHFNSLFNSKTNGYPPQFDSSDDQFSISRGVLYSITHQFQQKTWTPSEGISTIHPRKK